MHEEQSPNLVYAENLAILSAALELGAATLQKVVGSEALSTQLQGETQSRRDWQEQLASRLANSFGA